VQALNTGVACCKAAEYALSRHARARVCKAWKAIEGRDKKCTGVTVRGMTTGNQAFGENVAKRSRHGAPAAQHHFSHRSNLTKFA